MESQFEVQNNLRILLPPPGAKERLKKLTLIIKGAKNAFFQGFLPLHPLNSIVFYRFQTYIRARQRKAF